MVVLHELIEEFSELIVRVPRAKIDTDLRIDVSASRDNALFEGDLVFVLLFLVLEPILIVEVPCKEGLLVAIGELGEGEEILRALDPGTTVGDTFLERRHLELGANIDALTSSATHV